MTLTEKLVAVQSQMKAPKNLYNSFGKYNYRNAEGICESFKPFGKQYGLSLVLSDDVVEIGGRVYVKATATLADGETGDRVSVSAFAREAETKKGMDESQVTGATSSYARKYALNGLFLLDDTKDPDTDEYRQQGEARSKRNEAPAESQMDGKQNSAPGYPSIGEMRRACEVYYKGDNLLNMLNHFGARKIADLNRESLMVAYNMTQKGKK